MTDQATVTKITRLELSSGPEKAVTPEDKIHGLLNDSIEKIAQGWIDQLTALRENATALEGQVLSAMAATKESIARLHSLGQQVAAEASRGQKVIASLSDGIARIGE